MDNFVVIWGFIFLLIVSIIVGLIYLAYRIPKRLGKRKLGLFLSGSMIAGLLTLIITTVFEDKLFLNLM